VVSEMQNESAGASSEAVVGERGTRTEMLCGRVVIDGAMNINGRTIEWCDAREVD
jgi:hypothetical protein